MTEQPWNVHLDPQLVAVPRRRHKRGRPPTVQQAVRPILWGSKNLSAERQCRRKLRSQLRSSPAAEVRLANVPGG
jgi:hypothetical protein